MAEFCCEQGFSKEVTMQNLIEKYHFSHEAVEQIVNEVWEREMKERKQRGF